MVINDINGPCMANNILIACADTVVALNKTLMGHVCQVFYIMPKIFGSWAIIAIFFLFTGKSAKSHNMLNHY